MGLFGFVIAAPASISPLLYVPDKLPPPLESQARVYLVEEPEAFTVILASNVAPSYAEVAACVAVTVAVPAVVAVKLELEEMVAPVPPAFFTL